MARKGGIWDQVRQIVESGQAPVITLGPEQEVTTQRKNSPGRPPNLPEEKNFRHYLGVVANHVRPRCYNWGCRNFLRVDDRYVCSDFCRNELMKEARKILFLFEGDWKVKLPKVKSEEGMSR